MPDIVVDHKYADNAQVDSGFNFGYGYRAGNHPPFGKPDKNYLTKLFV
jgi:hypothetical protein